MPNSWSSARPRPRASCSAAVRRWCRSTIRWRRGSIDAAFADSVAIGKRYVDEESGLEVLGAKPGKGSLAFTGAAMTIKGAKPLPASD